MSSAGKRVRQARPGKVTMSDVAKLADVSLMSVSNSFRYPEKVSAKVRSRVLEAASKLDYLPNVLAGTLASGQSRVVGVVVPSVRNSNFAGMIQGLEEALGGQGYDLMLALANDPERELKAVTAFLGRRVDGIVLTGIEHDEETSQLLRRARTPVVETWSLNGPFIDMGVGFSLFEAAFAMGSLMISRGYRRIGFAGYEPAENPRFSERQRGFQAAMRQAGLPDDIVFFAQEATGYAAGRVAMEGLLDREPKLEAMLCATDVLAVGAIFECNRRGWKIPERFAVAGYGDYDVAAEITPALTTVRTPGQDIGVSAAQMLIARLDGRTAKRIVDVGYEVIVRASV